MSTSICAQWKLSFETLHCAAWKAIEPTRVSKELTTVFGSSTLIEQTRIVCTRWLQSRYRSFRCSQKLLVASYGFEVIPMAAVPVILYVLAFVCFLLAAFWVALGLASWVLAIILGGLKGL